MKPAFPEQTSYQKRERKRKNSKGLDAKKMSRVQNRGASYAGSLCGSSSRKCSIIFSFSLNRRVMSASFSRSLLRISSAIPLTVSTSFRTQEKKKYRNEIEARAKEKKKEERQFPVCLYPRPPDLGHNCALRLVEKNHGLLVVLHSLRPVVGFNAGVKTI